MKNRLMKWSAVCGDTVYTEEGNPFAAIDRDNLDYFLLEGLDTTFKHNVRTGQYNINDNSFVFLLNDKLIGKSNDVINYKEVLKALVSNPDEPTFFNGYYTGWKEKSEDFDYIEVLFWVDMVNQEIKVRVRATPNNDSVLNSTLTMIYNGMLMEQELEFDESNVRKEFVFKVL